MALTYVHLIIASIFSSSLGRLSVHQDRSHFFRYETVNFSCADGGGRVMHLFSNGQSQPCESGWGQVSPRADCIIDGVYTTDSGTYWCEEEEELKINITVTSDPVILSVPVYPVHKGALVSLQCLYKGRFDEHLTTNFTATFYKNGQFIWKSQTGIYNFFAQEPGLYKCERPDHGMSMEVPLMLAEPSSTTSPSVTDVPPPSLDQPIRITVPRLLCFILLFVLYTIILFIALSVYRKWARARAEAKRKGADRLI